jgi:hypothetical protein
MMGQHAISVISIGSLFHLHAVINKCHNIKTNNTVKKRSNNLFILTTA